MRRTKYTLPFEVAKTREKLTRRRSASSASALSLITCTTPTSRRDVLYVPSIPTPAAVDALLAPVHYCSPAH